MDEEVSLNGDGREPGQRNKVPRALPMVSPEV